jgi:hypothetical protein
MSDTNHSSIKLFRGDVHLSLECTCGEEHEITVTCVKGGSDFDELEAMANCLVGFSETGSCAYCEREQAAEDAADSAMRDHKAGMESQAEHHFRNE